MSDGNRILILDEEWPYPLDSGKRIRSYNLLSQLAGEANLHYLAFGHEGSAAFREFQNAGMNPLAAGALIPKLSGPGFYWRLLANLFSPDPFIVSRHRSALFRQKLHEACKELDPQVLLCEWTPYASYFTGLEGPCKVIVAHNMEQTIWRRYVEHARPGPKRWYLAEQARKVARFEAWAFRHADAAIAVSAREAQEIAAINPEIPVEVIDNGVDLTYFRAEAPEAEAPESDASMVFVGAMNWRPNQDAMGYFADEILPRVQARRPEASVSVVGQHPPEAIRRLGSRRGIEVLGRVDDVRPYVRDAAVYIVPLRIGGGTRLKILEALAMEKAVVSTSVGAEGLEVSHGEDILLADTPEEFAEQILALFEDPAMRRRLGTAGRRLVERRYGWDALAEKQWRFIETILRKRF